MRFEIVEAYLKPLATPEQTRIIMQALEAMGEIGDIAIEGIIDDVLAREDQWSEDLPFHLMEVVIRPNFQKLFTEFGIVISKDSNLQIQTSILNGLIAIEDESFHSAIRDIISTDQSNEEMFSEVLSQVTDLESIEVLEVTESVSSSFVELLSEMVSEIDDREEIDLPDPKVREESRNRVKSYLANISDSSWIADKIRDGFMCGIPFKTGFGIYSKEIESLIENSPESAIKAFIGLFLSSSAHLDELDESITQWIHSCCDEIDQSARWIGIYNTIKSQLFTEITK